MVRLRTLTAAFHARRMRNALQAYHDGELAPSAQAKVARHIRSCPQCAAASERLASVERLLSGSRPEPARLPRETAQALFEQAFAQANAAPSPLRRVMPVRLRIIGATFALTLAVGIGAYLSAPRQDGGKQGLPIAHIPRNRPSSKRRAVPRKFERAPQVAKNIRRADTAVTMPGHRVRRRRRHWRREYDVQGAQFAANTLHFWWRMGQMAAAQSKQSAMAAIGPLDRKPARRLLVVVLNTPTPPAEPILKVTVTHESDNAPGIAQVTTYQTMGEGRGILAQCLIARNSEGETSTHYALSEVSPGLRPATLTLQTALGNASIEKGITQ